MRPPLSFGAQFLVIAVALDPFSAYFQLKVVVHYDALVLTRNNIGWLLVYNAFFGFKENPFSIAPDPRYLFQGPRDTEALAHFQYGLSVSGGFVQLTGEVGTGKTMLIRALLEQLPEDVDVALVLNPVMTVMEFTATILDELRIKYPKRNDSLKVLVDKLNDYLLKNHSAGRRTVLIMDEAQNLSRDVLEQVRLLTNLETSKEKLLQIILVGQQELEEKLARQDMRQLAQRITARYKLKGLTKRETYDYIAHRCHIAGSQRNPFSSAAMSWIYRLTRGNPRITNIVCDRALLGAYSANISLVNPRVVQKAAEEVGDSVPGRHWRRQYALIGSAIAAGIVVSITAVWYFTGFSFDGQGNKVVAKADVDRVIVEKSESKIAIAGDASLASLLSNKKTTTDTDAAFENLFTRWGHQTLKLAGRSGCEAAIDAGLSCVFNMGTWNNLRQYNRPAVLELKDKKGQRHHVVLASLNDKTATLEFGSSKKSFPIGEIDQHWFGKYLLLWQPPPSYAEDVLRVGNKGPAIMWLRERLASYKGTKPANLDAKDSDIFDVQLEKQIKDFQRRHHLVADGVVGQYTFMRLNNYNPLGVPPRLTEVSRSRTS